MIFELCCRISFGKAYETKRDVVYAIEDTDVLIDGITQELHSLLTLQDRIEEKTLLQTSSTATALREEIKEKREALEELYDEKSMLRLLLINWDECHDADGKPKPRPDMINWQTAYLDV